MTDFVTEMMKTAGCKTRPRGCTNDDVNEYTDYISNYCEGDCEDCIWYDLDEYYPDFTAEKQLKIIKLIADSDNGAGGIGIFKIADDYYCTPECYWQIGKRATTNTDFTQALAQLTTELMKAGELDKEKVKEILK